MRQNLVLIHGWGFDRRVWASLTPYLEDRWRVHCVDLPGYRNTAEVGADLDHMARIIDRDVPENAHILAWSLGGLAAMQLIYTRADIKTLTLIAGSPCFLKRSDWRWGIEPAAFERLATHLSRDQNAALREFAGLVALGDQSPRKTLVTLNAYLDEGQPKITVLKDGLALLRTVDLRRSMGWQRVTGMIFGERDTLIPPPAGTMIQHATSATIPMATVPKTGHAPFISSPAETAVAFNKLVAD